MPVNGVELVREGIDLRYRDGELRVKRMRQVGPQRLDRETEQARLGIEAMESARHPPDLVAVLVEGKRQVGEGVVADTDRLHADPELGALRRNDADLTGPEGASEDGIAFGEWRVVHRSGPRGAR